MKKTNKIELDYIIKIYNLVENGSYIEAGKLVEEISPAIISYNHRWGWRFVWFLWGVIFTCAVINVVTMAL